MFQPRKIGIIGLGKMGFRIAERLLDQGYMVVATDLNLRVMRHIKKKGVITVKSLAELTKKLLTPRIILISITTGEVDALIKDLVPHLSKGDIIIDSGNSFYKDSQLRAKSLKEGGIHFLDVGISGGVRGARNGACLMIGGGKEVVENIKDVFEALSKEGSYKYLGKSGAGHLVKGYHNLVEYGYLQALSEILACLHKLSTKEKINLDIKDVCEIWDKRSIVESKLVKYAKTALKKNPSLKGIGGSVFGQTQKEMEKLVKIAKDNNVEVPSCEAALNARMRSQKKPTLAGKITNAIRNVFGGHKEWEKQ